MNLLLHGVEDFEVARGDTLRDPGFHRDDRLERFHCVVANPPFSLKNWGREAWATDPYGRNQYGLAPDVDGRLCVGGAHARLDDARGRARRRRAAARRAVPQRARRARSASGCSKTTCSTP